MWPFRDAHWCSGSRRGCFSGYSRLTSNCGSANACSRPLAGPRFLLAISHCTAPACSGSLSLAFANSYRLPFYTLCKTAIFAYFASGRGIDYVYHTFLEPLFREHEPQIDSFIANLKARAGEGAKGSIGWVWDTGRKAMGVSEAEQRSCEALVLSAVLLVWHWLQTWHRVLFRCLIWVFGPR